MKPLKELLALEISNYVPQTPEQVRDNIVKPPRPDLGDYAYRTFPLAAVLKMNPAQIAKDLEGKINEQDWSAEAEGPYLNLKLVNPEMMRQIILQARKNSYGNNDSLKGTTTVIDYSAPNLGKPLHVGHIRSTILGDSIGRIIKSNNGKVHGINYLGDIGLHLGKVIAAYKRWGNDYDFDAEPEKSMLELYVRFNKEAADDKQFEAEAKKVVEALERKDSETEKILSMLQHHSTRAFDRVYTSLNITFDEVTGQSHFSELGKVVVNEMLTKGIAHKDKTGAVIVNLDKYGLPPKVVLRSDGTAIYSTQDLGAATHRHKTHDFDSLLYVVASEQELYFKQLFAMLDKAGYDWADKCEHINFGMINLAEGKMSTREGKIVYLEEVLDKATNKVKEGLQERYGSIEGLDDIARTIGVGAVKYMVLSVDYSSSLEFSWDSALDFAGDSSACVQYSVVRAQNILKQLDLEPKLSDYKFLEPTEHDLIVKMGDMPDVIEQAGKLRKPHLVARYALDLARTFNKFYKNVRVRDEDHQADRVALLQAYTTVATNSLEMLGIGIPERM